MDIREAFKKARAVQEAYFQYSLNRGYPISIDDLTDTVLNYCDEVKKIVIKKVGYDPKHIIARLKRFEDGTAEIAFTSELNLCHRRYAVTKELAHLIIDTDDSFTKNYTNLVLSLVDSSSNIVLEECFQSEWMAEFVACELLMPYSERQVVFPKLETGEMSHFKIADYYKIPQSIVKKLSRDHLHQILGSIMAQIDGD